jgi:hypothetical protein
MKIFLSLTLAFALSSFAMEEVRTDKVTKTPCPLINVVLAHMNILKKLDADATRVSLNEICLFAKDHYNIDPGLMFLLGKARAINGFIVFDDLLDPTKTPAHRGSLARRDPITAQGFASIDEERLNVLQSNFTLLINEEGTFYRYLSYESLRKYQIDYCFTKNMKSGEKIIAEIELEMLWRLFGGYKKTVHYQSQDVDVIPAELVDDFLRNSKLPENFKQTMHPFTRTDLFCKAGKSGLASLLGCNSK